jgi:hypothetical protein
MSPTSYRCSTPRRAVWLNVSPPHRGGEATAAASPPGGSPPQYSPALRWVTTGFGMGPGGASALAATGASPPPRAGKEKAAGTTSCASRSHNHHGLRHATAGVDRISCPRALHEECERRMSSSCPPKRGSFACARRRCPPSGAGRPGAMVHDGPVLVGRPVVIVGEPPWTIRTGGLRSVTRRPPPA